MQNTASKIILHSIGKIAYLLCLVPFVGERAVRFLWSKSAILVYLFRFRVKKEKMQNIMLQTFVEKTFGGSSAELVMQALGNHKTSAEELKKIRELLDRIEQEKT